MQLLITDAAKEFLNGRERPVALDYLAGLGWGGHASVSVDTYAKKANKSAYQLVKEKGVEILVSKNLASKAAAILVEQKKFLFFK